MSTPAGRILAAPTVTAGGDASRAMDARCRELVREAEQSGTIDLTITVEPDHPDPALASRCLMRAGLAEDEPELLPPAPDGARRIRRIFRIAFGPLGDLVDGTQRLSHWPQKEADKRRAMAWLAGCFEAARVYAEREVDAVIEAHHRFGDRNLLRRELINRHLLVRDPAGRECRKAA